MRKLPFILALCAALPSGSVAAQGASSPRPSLYDFTLPDIDGRPLELASFKGKVVLVVNVASKCGYTPQYKGLEALYERFKDRGLVILGFPSNDFLGQEPGSEAAIKQFCSLTYGVSFPLFSKIRVKGSQKAPLYAYLTSKTDNGAFGGGIKWNFTKFLVDREGRTIARFESADDPASPAFIAAIEKALG